MKYNFQSGKSLMTFFLWNYNSCQRINGRDENKAFHLVSSPYPSYQHNNENVVETIMCLWWTRLLLCGKVRCGPAVQIEQNNVFNCLHTKFLFLAVCSLFFFPFCFFIYSIFQGKVFSLNCNVLKIWVDSTPNRWELLWESCGFFFLFFKFAGN